MEWMNNNYMIANPSKFHAIILTRNPKDMVKITLNIERHLRKNEAEVDLLGIRTDQRLSFSSHISNICKKAPKQLNALKQLSSYLSFSQRKVLALSFTMSNFNSCLTICSAKDLHKIEKVNELALCFVYDDYTSTHCSLLDKAETCTVECKRIHFICTEILKILNQIGPTYMSNLITPRQSRYSSQRPIDFFVHRVNQTTYSLKRFRCQGSKLWKSLPDNILKTSTNLSILKKLLKTWYSSECNCNYCRFME